MSELTVTCPQCEHENILEVELCEEKAQQFVQCWGCGIEIAYDIELEPCSANVREMPQCRFQYNGHEFSKAEDMGRYLVRECVFCGEKDTQFKDDGGEPISF